MTSNNSGTVYMIGTKQLRYIILFSFILSFSPCAGQLQGQARLDSLLRVLSKYRTEDTNQVKLILDIGFLYRNNEPLKAIEYGEKGLRLAQKINWQAGIGKGYNTLGTAYKAQSNYLKALEHFQNALSVFEAQGNKRSQSIVLMNIGTIYRPLKEYAKAREYYHKALMLTDGLGMKRETGQLYGNIAVTYFEEENVDTATIYNLKALKIFVEINDQHNRSWILANLGDAYAVKKDYEEALKYIQSAVVINRELNELNFLGSNLGRIGEIQSEMADSLKSPTERRKQLMLSVENSRQALAILTDIDDPDYLKDVYKTLAHTQEKLG